VLRDKTSQYFTARETQWLRFNYNFQTKIQTTRQIKVNFIWCKIYISWKHIKFHNLAWLLRINEVSIVCLSAFFRILFYGIGCPVRLNSLFISSHCSAVIIMSPSNASTPFPIHEQIEPHIYRGYFGCLENFCSDFPN